MFIVKEVGAELCQAQAMLSLSCAKLTLAKILSLLKLPSEIKFDNFDKISKTNLEGGGGVNRIFSIKNNLGAFTEFRFLIWCQSNQWLMSFDTISVDETTRQKTKI